MATSISPALIHVIESELAYGCEETKSSNYEHREQIRNNPYYINPLIEKLGATSEHHLVKECRGKAQSFIKSVDSQVSSTVLEGFLYANEINPNLGLDKATLLTL